MSTTSADHYTLFATAGRGLEPLLADELKTIGAEQVRPTSGGVHFEGDQSLALRCCLWSRIANRILLPIQNFRAPNPDQLYHECMRIDWRQWFESDRTIAIDASLNRSAITHSRFAEQRVKDAIVDRFRQQTGTRPDVDREQPDIRINLHVNRDLATLSLDLSGDSLHRRGYRRESGAAPLKENLAAAILMRAGWPEIAAAGGALYDPMCGSGTLLIEGAWMAADIAPGLMRTHYGFLAWRDFQPNLWQQLLDEAELRKQAGLNKLSLISGSDRSIKAVGIARANIQQAGLKSVIQVDAKPLRQAHLPAGKGLVVTNPPYGERLGEVDELKPLYRELGEWLQKEALDWRATLFTGNIDLAFEIPLRAHKSHQLFNGPIPCKAFHFEVTPERFFQPEEKSDPSSPWPDATPKNKPAARAPKPLSEGGQMLANRLRKNRKQLEVWAKQQDVTCYRVYDADLPEYAVAIDLYQAEQPWVHIQEYQAPKSIDSKLAGERLQTVLAVVPEALDVTPNHMALKVRKRQKGRDQYQKQESKKEFHRVREGRCRFWVNFHDYLDTGLFLDHRPTRQLIGQKAQGKRFLNLFAYTATATVQAALGGARSSTSVDLSKTYLDWAQRNFKLNQIVTESHQLIQSDCLQWLEAAQRKLYLFDLIFIDPPTFSNSKRTTDVFDVQRDHVKLIRGAVALLAPKGELIFSTNSRRFKLDQEALADLAIDDLSAKTVPRDFARNPKIHQCWLIQRRDKSTRSS